MLGGQTVPRTICLSASPWLGAQSVFRTDRIAEATLNGWQGAPLEHLKPSRDMACAMPCRAANGSTPHPKAAHHRGSARSARLRQALDPRASGATSGIRWAKQDGDAVASATSDTQAAHAGRRRACQHRANLRHRSEHDGTCTDRMGCRHVWRKRSEPGCGVKPIAGTSGARGGQSNRKESRAAKRDGKTRPHQRASSSRR